MGVSWSDQAEAELRSIANPAVRRQIRRNAELPEVVHHIPPRDYPVDEGHHGGIMWHRAISHGRSTGQDDGPVGYFLFYRSRRRNPPEFEIKAVRSLRQMASMWVQMNKGPDDIYDVQ
jgi:hypothetical protein